MLREMRMGYTGMKVLIACEFSGVVRDAFAARGHDAWSCDLLPSDRPGNHIQDDVLNHLDEGWDLMIAHPPCTFITNAGVRHLYSIPSRNGVVTKIHGKKRREEMIKACDFFNTLKRSKIPRLCIENPVPHGYAVERIGSYSQIIQPWMFGHGETKATCLWLKNLPLLVPTKIVYGREHNIHMASPGPDRWKKRSITFAGIAEAMADKWGGGVKIT